MRQNKEFRVATFTFINSVIWLLIVYITDINWMYASIIIPILNIITKYINVHYLNDIWVNNNGSI